MDTAIEIGKTSATGSFHLLIGKIASTVILAVGTIVLGALIAESDYGLYAVALIPSATFLLFQDWGVGTAIARQCAQFRKANKEADLRKTIIAGLTFEVTTALVLTIISVVTANFMASTVFDKPESTFLIAFASISIFSTALFTITQNVFVGFENMKLISLTLICQAIAQSVIAPLLVYSGYGALGALVGFTLGSVIASIIAFILLYFVILRKLKKETIQKSDITETLKPFLKYGLPLAIGSILIGILTQFNSIMMVSYIKDLTLIGNYKIATNFAVLLTFLTAPIATVLFPAFSKLDHKKEPHLVKTVFASSVKYTALLLVPSTMILIVLSGNIIGTLYGAKWSFAPAFLALSVLGNLLAILGSLSVGGFLYAFGETRLVLKTNIISLALGVSLALVLIPSLGIPGMIIGSLFTGVPSLLIGLYFVRKKYGAKIDLPASAKILASSAIAATAVYIFLNVFATVYWLKLVSGAILFLAIFLIAVPLFGGINQVDIANLRVLLSGLGTVSRILEIPLTIMEKTLKIRVPWAAHGKVGEGTSK